MGERTDRLDQESVGETAAQDEILDHHDTDTLLDGVSDGTDTGPHSTRQEKQWDEATFFANLERRRGRAEAGVARKVLDWARSKHLRIWWGKGLQDGSFFPKLDHGNMSYWTVAVWTYGRVEIQFQWMVNKPPFDQEARRQELLRRFNQLPGVSIPASAITKRPSIALAVLREGTALSLFLQTLEWVVQEARSVAGDANSTSGHMGPEHMTSSPPEEPNMKHPPLVSSPGQARETGARKFWLMRAGNDGEAKELFLKEGLIAMDWLIEDQGAFPSDSKSFIQAFLERYRLDHPEEENTRSLSQIAWTNYRFVHQMASGDGLVLVPKKALDPHLYLGQITSDYYFQPTPPPLQSDFTHQRKVQWQAPGLRSDFSAAFIHMVEHYLGTLCQIDEQYYAELSSRLQHQGK